MIRKLHLKEITVINRRVEDWDDDVIADVVTARSVANPITLRKWVADHVHKKSVLVCTLNKAGKVDIEGSKDIFLESGEEAMRLGIIPL